MQNQFRDLCVKLQGLLGQEGLHIVPFESPSLPFFTSLTQEHQSQIIDLLNTLVEIALDLQSQKLKVTEPINLIKTFFKKFNLHAPGWVIDTITKRDVVDVYNMDSRLVVASFNFFEICAYSIEEIFCRPWAELWSREGDIHIKIFQLCRSLLNGEITQPVDMTYIPQHKVSETYTASGRSVIIQPRIFSPVYFGDKLFGFMSINRIIRFEPEQIIGLTDD
ncbi:MAG: hypothetical protein V4654_01330 [Bdellovibrionota bacterium]